jgi:hypothetical protein
MKLADAGRYLLPVKRNDWDELLVDWMLLIPAESSCWLLTRFGELFLEQKDGKIGMLQVSAFHYQVVAKDKTDFEEWLVDPDKWSEWFLSPLVDRLEAAGKNLNPDCCYSFILPLGLNGQFALDNVAIIPIENHFRGLGIVFRQIKDVPTGTRVVLK